LYGYDFERVFAAVEHDHRNVATGYPDKYGGYDDGLYGGFGGCLYGNGKYCRGRR